jgi:hypothetical protein
MSLGICELSSRGLGRGGNSRGSLGTWKTWKKFIKTQVFPGIFIVDQYRESFFLFTGYSVVCQHSIAFHSPTAAMVQFLTLALAAIASSASSLAAPAPAPVIANAIVLNNSTKPFYLWSVGSTISDRYTIVPEGLYITPIPQSLSPD